MAEDRTPRADEPAEPDTDVEGHSLDRLLGMQALNRNARRHPEAATRREEDNLPRLTKPFPRMRDQKRG